LVLKSVKCISKILPIKSTRGCSTDCGQTGAAAGELRKNPFFLFLGHSCRTVHHPNICGLFFDLVCAFQALTQERSLNVFIEILENFTLSDSRVDDPVFSCTIDSVGTALISEPLMR
jgi:hypothetical protein